MLICDFNGKPYAVDLWWQVRSGGISSRKIMLHAARETAKELKENFNAVALRPHQYGLGTLETEPLRVPSLAAALRPQVQVNQGFLGIFRLGVGWWVCGISRGAIAAAGDRVFASEDEARAHVHQLRELFGSSEEIVCATEQESQSYLMPLLAPDAVVEALYPDPAQRRKWIVAGVVLVTLTMAGLGVKWFLDARNKEFAAQTARTLLQSKEARRQEILANPAQYFEQTWLSMPLLSTQSETCLPALLEASLSSYGWRLESALCRVSTSATLVLNWGHRPGASYTQLPPDARLETTKKALSQRRLASLPARQSDAPLLSRSVVTARLYEITRRLECRLRSSWSSPETKIVDDVEVSAPWVRGSWQLSGVPAGMVLSGDVFTLLGTVPGLYLSDITIEKQQWNMKGAVYAAHP